MAQPESAPATITDQPRRKALEAVEDAFRLFHDHADLEKRDCLIILAARLRELNSTVTWEQVREALEQCGVRVASTDQLRAFRHAAEQRASSKS